MLTIRVLSRQDCYRNNSITRLALVSLTILTFITFVGNFTQLQLSAALPTIVREFNISVTTGQWLTSIFQLMMGIMVPLTAYLTRRFSTRQIIVTSMVFFTIGSAVAWLAPNFLLLLLGRTLEAIGSGVMWPVLQITVFSIYPLSKRGMAMGTVGMAMSVAPAIGPTLGGWQTEVNGWRSIFLSLTVIGVICMLVSVFFLQNFDGADTTARADFFSVGLSIFGFGGLLFGFTNLKSYPVAHPMVWLTGIIGIVCIVWFVIRQIIIARRFHKAEHELALLQHQLDVVRQDEQQSQQSERSQQLRSSIACVSQTQPPLLDLGVLHNRSFTVGTCCAAVSYFAFSSILVIIPLFIQNDRGFNAIMSGMIMLPGAFGQCIAQFFAGKMLDRVGARPVALTGTITLFIGTLMMAFIINDSSWIWWISIWQFVRQIGMGFVLMPVTTWSLNCLETKEVSAGSAVTNTARQIAAAIGAPIMVLTMETIAAAHRSQVGSSVSAIIESSTLGIRSVLFISSAIIFIQVVLIMFFVRGDGAGSTRDLTHRALAKMHHSAHAHFPHVIH